MLIKLITTPLYNVANNIFFSIIGLIILWPVIFLCWLIAAIETRSNGFFIQKRVGQKVMGFGSPTLEVEEELRKEAIRHVEPEDLLAFGMIPEFIGRLPVVSSLRALTEEEMVAILTETKNAMVKQYTKLFSMEGVRLSLTKDALRALAAQAVTKGTGARALRSMLERIMLDIMYEVPSRVDIAEVTINRAVVEGRKLPLIRKKQDKTAA